MMNINQLWHSRNETDWIGALTYYDKYIIKDEVRQLDNELDPLDLDAIRNLDAQGWYSFLRDKYFRWKYTAPNRLATTTASLDKSLNTKGAQSLLAIGTGYSHLIQTI